MALRPLALDVNLGTGTSIFKGKKKVLKEKYRKAKFSRLSSQSKN